MAAPGYSSTRVVKRPLVIAGPAGGGNHRVHFPGVGDFLAAMLDARVGAFAYLHGYLDGTDGLPPLQIETIPGVEMRGAASTPASSDVAARIEHTEARRSIELDDSPFVVEALPVSHGPVPAVAYAASARGHRIVFAGDHDGRGDGLAAFARDADLLVMHLPIPEDAGNAARALHATPSRVGEIAVHGALARGDRQQHGRFTSPFRRPAEARLGPGLPESMRPVCHRKFI